ncbi:MAG: response regulator [Desulfomonilaceae bacterium]
MPVNRHNSVDDYSSIVGSPTTRGSVLVIDDDAIVLGTLRDLLAIKGFSVLTAGGGAKAIEIFKDRRPDLVVTDIHMPQINGLEVLATIRQIDGTVPVVVVTGHGDLENAVLALRRGAHDFLLKPVNTEILLNAVQKGVEHCRLRRFEKDYRYLLEEEVEQRTTELMKSYQRIRRIQGASIFALAKLAESRDGETAFHLLRLQEYCRILCNQAAVRERYQEFMTQEFIDDLVQCSVLHDIGKVGIPDSILFNPKKFGIDEFEIMKRHSVYGGAALEEAAHEAGDKESYLFLAKDVAYYHHERWDGNGYPFGLKEEAIPLSARIVAIADVYDALTTERRYKRSYSHEEAREIIVREKGKHFDPELVEAFLEAEDKFEATRDRIVKDRFVQGLR